MRGIVFLIGLSLILILIAGCSGAGELISPGDQVGGRQAQAPPPGKGKPPPDWVELTPMNHPRMSFTEQVVDRKIYVIGGADQDRNVVNTVECFDINRGTWTDCAPMPTARFACSSAVVDGKIYVFGGSFNFFANLPITDVIEIYDPKTDSWSDGGTLPSPRTWPMGEAIGEDIYIVGGFNGYSMLSTGWKYSPFDPVQQWRDIAPLPIVRSGHDIVSHNASIYTLGGYDGAPLLRYDPRVDIWTGVNDLAPLPVNRVHLRMAVVGDTIYSTGGGTLDDVIFNEVWQYDIIGDTWSPGPPLPIPTSQHSTVAYRDAVYVFGGKSADNMVTGRCFILIP